MKHHSHSFRNWLLLIEKFYDKSITYQLMYLFGMLQEIDQVVLKCRVKIKIGLGALPNPLMLSQVESHLHRITKRIFNHKEFNSNVG